MILFVAPVAILVESEALVAFATSGGLAVVGVVIHVSTVVDSDNLVK